MKHTASSLFWRDAEVRPSAKALILQWSAKRREGHFCFLSSICAEVVASVRMMKIRPALNQKARPRNRPRLTSRHSATRWLGRFLFSRVAHRVADLGRSAKKDSERQLSFRLTQPQHQMRKAISILFFILFIASLPRLITGFSTAPNISFLIGQIVASLLMLILGLHFWKVRPKKAQQ